MEKESEKVLESRLVEEVRQRGGLTVKLTSQFHRGLPDRLVLLSGGRAMFVEVKSTGEKPRALQLRAHGMLRVLGFEVFVIDSTCKLEDFLHHIDTAR